MPSVLVLFAHPTLEQSRVNRTLIEGITQIPNVTFHDLYEEYPDFYIDVQREQGLLLAHDVIIWQHPLYWYSVPPLLKLWIDQTLERNWAYGRYGVFLKGKRLINVITAGGNDDSYSPTGFNNYAIHDYLLPWRQTAELCNMDYLPPYFIGGTFKLTDAEINTARAGYHDFLRQLTIHAAPSGGWATANFANEAKWPDAPTFPNGQANA